MADVAKIISDVKALGTEPEKHKDGMSKKKAAFSGALVGIVIGLMASYTWKWNLFYGAIGGGIIGGSVASLISPKD